MLALAQGLPPKLEHLDLRNNGLRDKGAAVLAEACTRCPALRKLDVSGFNGLTKAGKQALRAACPGVLVLTSRKEREKAEAAKRL